MPLRGTYALFLQLDHDTPITVGRLGTFHFPAGYYIYVGSALGSGGLSARLARHYRQHKRLHWHIDYLLAHARIVGVETETSGKRLECAWAQKWLDTPGAQEIALHFGASDCVCSTHLIYVGNDWPGDRNKPWTSAGSH